MPETRRRKTTETPRKGARGCKVCQHPKRALIDKLLVKGKPVNAVAKAYGLTEASVRRHVKHIRAMVTKAQAQRDRRRRLAMLSVEEDYERDGRELNRLIEASTNVEEKQKWYLVKFRWYDLGLKYAFLSASLRRRSVSDGKDSEKERLPEAVQRVIDAVVSDA
ncbi:MAG: hypothetical protein WC683_07675 [bacterium]